MQQMRMVLVVLVACAVACGDDEKSDGDVDTDIDGGVGGDGSTGGDGADGSDGSDGTDGSDGSDGTDGTDGSDGADGTDGTGGTSGSDGTSGSCEVLDVTTCEDREDCVTIDGRPMEAGADGRMCVDYGDPAQPVGCMSIDMGCDGALSMAQNPESGDPWLFPSGCLPTGWELLEWIGYVECE